MSMTSTSKDTNSNITNILSIGVLDALTHEQISEPLVYVSENNHAPVKKYPSFSQYISEETKKILQAKYSR